MLQTANIDIFNPFVPKVCGFLFFVPPPALIG